VDPGFREDLESRYRRGQIEPEQYNSAVYALTNLKRDWYFVRSAKCGRVFTPVNGLRRTLRPYLTINGDPDLSIVDVSACQPTLLLQLIREHCSEGAYQEWYDLVFIHDIYMFLGFELPQSPSRDDCKQFLMRILFCSNRSRFPEKRFFEDRFPEVSSMLRKLKKGNHAALAIALQQLESSIMIDVVCTQLEWGRIPSFTIHDGILVQTKYAPKVTKVIEQAFKRAIGEEPNLKTDRYCRYPRDVDGRSDAEWTAGSNAKDFGFGPHDDDF
jgi:hypothetical protein